MNAIEVLDIHYTPIVSALYNPQSACLLHIGTFQLRIQVFINKFQVLLFELV